MIAILSAVQTAACLASGAITANTAESLEIEPSVWPVSLPTVQPPLPVVHWAVLPLIMYTPSPPDIQ
jgi:hypothetical protein